VPFGDAKALRAAIGPDTAAVMIEPMQGEAGIVIPPDGYLAAVRRACDEAGVLLVLDEVQTGLGRTGRLFAFQHEGVRPDVLILGKALGGGVLPVSAVLADRAVLGLMEPGSHGSTFGGNPLAAAVSKAALDVIVEERLPERAAELGAVLIERLSALRGPGVRDVRGRGLFVGVELDPAVLSAHKAAEALLRAGILTKETHETVLRFAPPLVISRAELDEGVDRILATLRALLPA
jgi:ornithine--oxo-acid transaminase